MTLHPGKRLWGRTPAPGRAAQGSRLSGGRHTVHGALLAQQEPSCTASDRGHRHLALGTPLLEGGG